MVGSTVYGFELHFEGITEGIMNHGDRYDS